MDTAALQQRKAYGFSLIAAALLLVISTFFWKGAETGVAGGILQVLSCMFWVLGLLGLLATIRPAMPRLAAWMSIVATMACIGGNNWGMDGIFFEVYGKLGSGATHDAVYAAMGPAAVLTLQLPGLLFPLSLIIIGIALFRSGKAPAWCGILLAIGGLAFPISRITRMEMIAHLADLLILIPALVLGLRMLKDEVGTMKDEPEGAIVSDVARGRRVGALN